jgi:hypothetical protein
MPACWHRQQRFGGFAQASRALGGRFAMVERRHGGGSRGHASNPPTTVAEEIIEYFEARRKSLHIVKSTQAPSGQLLDWVPIETWHPGGRIPRPPRLPQSRQAATPSFAQPARFELEDPSVERGPPGTIPMVRHDFSKLRTRKSLQEFLGKPRVRRRPGRRVSAWSDPNAGGQTWDSGTVYFHAITETRIDVSEFPPPDKLLYGCASNLNVWAPTLRSTDDHSISQVWLTTTDTPFVTDAADLNYVPPIQTVEVGWTVDPARTGTNLPCLFVFFTTCGYAQSGPGLGGYDQYIVGAGGFQPTSTMIAPGMNIAPACISTPGGPQFFMPVQVVWGPDEADNTFKWWVFIKGEAIGFYPAGMFTYNYTPRGDTNVAVGGQAVPATSPSLDQGASIIQFGGEVETNIFREALDSNAPLIAPPRTTTQMGSGQYAENGIGFACFQSNMLVDRTGSWFTVGTPTFGDQTLEPIDTSAPIAADPLAYDIITDKFGFWGNSGGPPADAAPIQLFGGPGNADLSDGRPLFVADFDGDFLDDVVFYRSDGVWWLGLSDGNGNLQWNSTAQDFGDISGMPMWAGPFSGQSGANGTTGLGADVLFFSPADNVFNIGHMDPGGPSLIWSQFDPSLPFDDFVGAPTWAGDFAGIGRPSLLVYSASTDQWWLGTVSNGAGLSIAWSAFTADFAVAPGTSSGDIVGGPSWQGSFSGTRNPSTGGMQTDLVFYRQSDNTTWIGVLSSAGTIVFRSNANAQGNVAPYAVVISPSPSFVGNFDGNSPAQVLVYSEDVGRFLVGWDDGLAFNWYFVMPNAPWGGLNYGQQGGDPFWWLWSGDFNGDGITELLIWFESIPAQQIASQWWMAKLSGGSLNWQAAGANDLFQAYPPKSRDKEFFDDMSARQWTANITDSRSDSALLYDIFHGTFWCWSLQSDGQVDFNLVGELMFGVF